jgi:hypothetical protein
MMAQEHRYTALLYYLCNLQMSAINFREWLCCHSSSDFLIVVFGTTRSAAGRMQGEAGHAGVLKDHRSPPPSARLSQPSLPLPAAAASPPPPPAASTSLSPLPPQPSAEVAQVLVSQGAHVRKQVSSIL